MAQEENGQDTGLAEIIEKGLKALEEGEGAKDLEAKKEFLNEVKRHGIAGYRALVRFLLRKYPEEQKKMTTPRKK